ncbi:hypothetical protein KAI04_04060 [Candidatus Pacearchaeota archaeon]|nr:hypothetical protein [Candidatus Pacearchaeota archaeon]
MSLFCKHKWKEKERHKIIRTYYDGDKIPNCILILQECEKCGKLKKEYIP